MPVITLDLGIDQADEAKKKELIARYTADSVEVLGIPAEKFIVLIKEIPHDSLGIGGRSLKEIKAGV